MIKTNFQAISNNLSLAWATAFSASMDPGVIEISPLTITITDLTEDATPEIPVLRNAVDQTLLDCGEFESHTTANTIFPSSLWNPRMDGEGLYARYQRILPFIKKADHHNRYGTYFARMVDYGEKHKNQLDFIIKAYRGGIHRRSALQAAIYNPVLDQRKQPLRGFPCLQQVAFIPYPRLGELAIHGFYATQYLFERGYGNLLGLARLGDFMARQMGLRLSRVTSTASAARYGTIARNKLRSLEKLAREILGDFSQDKEK